MTQAELCAALKSLGMPVAYGEFKVPGPPLPFITYQLGTDNGFKADNHNYLDMPTYQIELYTKIKDPAAEKLLQDKLKELRLPYQKTEDWIDSEKMWQVVYEIQIVGG